MILAGRTRRLDLDLFGVVLIISGVRMGLVEHPPDAEKNPIDMDKMILSCLAEVHRGDLSCDESGNWHSRRLRQH